MRGRNIYIIGMLHASLSFPQIKYCSLMMLFNVYGAFQMLQYTFVGYTVPFTCLAADQDTEYHNECGGGPAATTDNCKPLEFPGVEARQYPERLQLDFFSLNDCPCRQSPPSCRNGASCARGPPFRP